MRICPHCEQHTEAAACPQDGAETVSLDAWTPDLGDSCLGALLNGRYRIEERIGIGAMGRVYRATDTRVARKVAVKVLRAELASDAEAQARFRQEVSVLARLHHRHIVHLYDHGVTDGGSLFLVMELLNGRSLAQVIREEAPMDPRRVVHLAQAVLDALVEAHAEGIVHRDLKPENLFLHTKRRTGEVVKVLDFGIAKVLGTTTIDGLPLTHRGVVLGTPHYLAPEQLRGQAVTPRSDLYAFGAIIYELLTGHRLFDHLPAAAVAQAHVETPAPPPEIKGRRLEGPLVDLVMACLAKDPAQRPHSAEEALIALEDFQERPLRALKRRETVPSFPVVTLDTKSAAGATPKPRTGRRVLVPTTPRERKPTQPAMPVADPASIAAFAASEAAVAATEARTAPPFESMQTGRSVSTQWNRDQRKKKARGLYVAGGLALAAGLGALLIMLPRGEQVPALERVINLPASAEHAEVVRAVADTAPSMAASGTQAAASAPQRSAAAAPAAPTAAAPAGEAATQPGLGAAEAPAPPEIPSSAAADLAVAPAVAPVTAPHEEAAAGAPPAPGATPEDGAAPEIASAQPAVVGTLRVEVVTDPAGAAIYVKGARVGRTPMWVEWPEHTEPPTVELVRGSTRQTVKLGVADAGTSRKVTLIAAPEAAPHKPATPRKAAPHKPATPTRAAPHEPATSTKAAPKPTPAATEEPAVKPAPASPEKPAAKPTPATPEKPAATPATKPATKGDTSGDKAPVPEASPRAPTPKKASETGAGTWGPVD